MDYPAGFKEDTPEILEAIAKFKVDFQCAVLDVMRRESISMRELERRTGISRNKLDRFLNYAEGVVPDLEQLVKIFDGVGYIAQITLVKPDD